MHICVVGDGVAGLMAANLFASRNYATKVTHISSSKIPTIGVGESTTLNFETLHREFDTDFDSFIQESDACIKLGVLYKNWANKDFLHHFRSHKLFHKSIEYFNILGNKDENTYIHDLVANKLFKDATESNLMPFFDKNYLYNYSWHFDAGKYIAYLKKLLKKRTNVTVIDDIVVKCNFSEKDTISSLILESNTNISANYYVICTGNNPNNSKIFNIEYTDLGNVLLTDKALFFPKKYTDKQKEIHPYTVAKTMKYGWRWITPTWSRVGTGYVFSSKHISIENAIKEFVEDIGDNSIEPNVVDFNPKYNSKTFKNNYMTLGMCNGFLEPLDAPGISISTTFTLLIDLIFKNNEINSNYQEKYNAFVHEVYLGWTAFILTQYKTCYRNDTDFWIDHKNVKFEYYDNIMQDFYNDRSTLKIYNVNDPDVIIKFSSFDFKMMMQYTTAAKNVKWKTRSKIIPSKMSDPDYETQSHYEFIRKYHNPNA